MPLASFFFLLLFGPRLGKASGHGAHVATGAIVAAGVLSFVALLVWLGHHFPGGEACTARPLKQNMLCAV